MTGEEFKALRKAVGLSQQALGEALGYEGRTAEMMVQKWEYGQRPINPKHFRKLSELLHVPLEKFIP